MGVAAQNRRRVVCLRALENCDSGDACRGLGQGMLWCRGKGADTGGCIRV